GRWRNRRERSRRAWGDEGHRWFQRRWRGLGRRDCRVRRRRRKRRQWREWRRRYGGQRGQRRQRGERWRDRRNRTDRRKRGGGGGGTAGNRRVRRGWPSRCGRSGRPDLPGAERVGLLLRGRFGRRDVFVERGEGEGGRLSGGHHSRRVHERERSADED